jgi:hypothetical protein
MRRRYDRAHDINGLTRLVGQPTSASPNPTRPVAIQHAATLNIIESDSIDDRREALRGNLKFYERQITENRARDAEFDRLQND